MWLLPILSEAGSFTLALLPIQPVMLQVHSAWCKMEQIIFQILCGYLHYICIPTTILLYHFGFYILFVEITVDLHVSQSLDTN